MPKFTTFDLGLAIRDFLEDEIFHHYDIQVEEPHSDDAAIITFVDVSDAHNPVVHLDNGQKFQIRIFAL